MAKGLSMTKFHAVSAATGAFASLGNAAVVCAVAVVTSTQDFGRIAVLLALLAATVGILRGALGTPLLSKADATQPDSQRDGSFAITTALLVSPLVGGLMWAVEGSWIRSPAILLILATPVILVHDVLRHIAIAEGHPRVAARWDGAWFLGSAALLCATWLRLPVATPTYLLGGWITLALIAVVAMFVALRVPPRLRQYRAWISDDWRRRVRDGAESGLTNTTLFALLLLVAVAVSPGVVAALCGAATLLAPVAITASAIRKVLLSRGNLWNSLARIALVTVSATVLLGLALFLLTPATGRLVLGSTFDEAQSIIPIVALGCAIGAWATAAAAWLRAGNRDADAVKLTIAHVLVLLVTVSVGALLFRTPAGAATGTATAATFAAAWALLRFRPWAAADFHTETSWDPHSGAGGAFGAGRDLVHVGTPAPLPLATRLRLGEAPHPTGALLTLWVFATMGVFVPAVFIRFTGVPAGLSWLWALPLLTISSARFAFLVGSGERRLFEMSFWIYCYAFLGLAPLVQLRLDDWPATVPRIDATYAGAATLIAVVGCCAFLGGVALDNATSVGRTAEPANNVAEQTFSINYTRCVVLALFGILAGIYLLSQVGWFAFLHSREEVLDAETLAVPDMSTFALLRSAGSIGPLVAFIALVRFRREAKNARARGIHVSTSVMRSSMVLLVVVGILLSDIMNPISSARYLAGTAMLAVAAGFGLFATKLRFRLVACGFLVGMLLVFPLADAFRYSAKGELKASNPVQSLLSGDYDSFAQLANGYLVGTREGIAFGRQFLGVLLFWVPRTLWTDKPLDTGPFIAQERGYSFTNLSAPLWIELFLNGGWVLLAIGMFALGYALHRWDNKLNIQCELNGMPSVLGCILPFYLMILLRGSLLQAASFLACIVVFPAFVVERRQVKARSHAPSAAPDLLPESGVRQRRTDYVYA